MTVASAIVIGTREYSQEREPVRYSVSRNRCHVACLMDLMRQSAVWRGMADEARKVAARLHDPELQRQMLIIAASYEALARRTEALARVTAVANSNEPAD